MKKLLILGLCICTLCGCSIIMSATSPTEKSPRFMRMDASEYEIDFIYGPASTYQSVTNGVYVKQYVWTDGSCKAFKIARVVGHAAADFVTCFVWELIGTPIELGLMLSYDTYSYFVVFKDGKVIKLINSPYLNINTLQEELNIKGNTQ